MGAGRDINYVSNQMMEVDTRVQTQLAAVKDGIHGKIEDHLDIVTKTLAALEQAVVGAIGVSQEERRAALQNVSEQISKFERRQALETRTILDAITTVNGNAEYNHAKLCLVVARINAEIRQDFWKLFFTSLWRSIKRIF